MESTPSTNNINNEATSKNKFGREIDIREVCGFLFSKIWIIALVTLCCIIIAFLYTRIITPMYSSSREVYVTNKNTNTNPSYNNNMSTTDIAVATQLTRSSEKIFKGYEFCSLVANELNNLSDVSEFLRSKDDTASAISFVDFYRGEIDADNIISYTSISSDEETCTIKLTITTASPELSAIISYVATASMQNYINDMNQANTIVIGCLDKSKGDNIPTSPSNIHPVRNMAICAVLGFVAICAILVCFFVFDDKIKVPDDIQKYLKINVLGEIPEIEEAWGERYEKDSN